MAGTFTSSAAHSVILRPSPLSSLSAIPSLSLKPSVLSTRNFPKHTVDNCSCHFKKKRRAIIADRKRATRGDPRTGKLKIKPQPQSISGKRQRKLLKKWRRDQKEAVEKGLVSMEDVEMVAAGAAETSVDAMVE